MTLRGTAALCALLAACASGSGEKAGVVRVKVPGAALDQAHGGRRFALVIGVSGFSDPGWRALRFAAKDADDVAAALKDPSRGGFDAVEVLAGAQQTRRRAILDAVAALGARANRPEDVVLVYVSSHGTLSRDLRGELRRYLVTSDSEIAKVTETGLPMDDLKAAIDALPSRRRVLLLASCYSGTGKSLLPADVQAELATIKSAGFFAAPLEEASRAAMIFSASDWGETAREDESLQNDIYTHFWIEGLDGRADRNLDGAVSATEAHDYARRNTFTFTEGRQRPSAEILEVGADPVIVSGKLSKTGTPELFSYQARLEGFTVRVDGQPVTELPGGVAVKAGTRKVELTKGGHTLIEKEIQLRAGERLDVESLLAPELPRSTVFATGGMFTFFDQVSAKTILPASWLAGGSLRYDDFPVQNVSLWIDAGMSAGPSTLQLEAGTIAFHYTAATGGVSFPFGWKVGALRLMTGPRVAGLWVRRSFTLSAYTANQDYVAVTPGWMAGMAYQPAPRWELGLQLSGVLSYVPVDGEGRWLGFGGASLGAGYRF